MLRIPFIYLLYASAFSVVLTLAVMSTQAGSWIAHITLIFLPRCLSLLSQGIYNLQAVFPALLMHFLWGLAAVYLYRKLTKRGRRPSATEK